ncbi:MAG: acyltransferase family protein [Lachnospiraceae bacterium]|nr:acyltransferase family protein [Lachnospiraceae bacterium]
MENRAKTDNRIYSFDLLRIGCAYLVILMHTTAQVLYAIPMEQTGTFRWLFPLLCNSLTHCSVPLFVMLSGALFLKKDGNADPKRLFFHSTLRILVLYFLWAFVYAFLSLLRSGEPLSHLGDAFTNAPYHLWYLPMVVGLYLLTPLINTFLAAADEKKLRYALLLFLICTIGFGTLLALPLPTFAVRLLSVRHETWILGYLGYYLLGYYLRNYPLQDGTFSMLRLAAALSLLLGFGGTHLLSVSQGQLNVALIDSFSLLTLLVSAYLFALVCRHSDYAPRTQRGKRFLRGLSADTLGIYIFHLAFLSFLPLTLLFPEVYYPVIGKSAATIYSCALPVYALLIYAAGALLSALLRRIPKAGRYLC